jgi:hypothetical protein
MYGQEALVEIAERGRQQADELSKKVRFCQEFGLDLLLVCEHFMEAS